jgi:hypothetical protein
VGDHANGLYGGRHNDTLPATARQVMYAARPEIQERTGRQLDDQYFTQTLLPDYMEKHDVDWDVVFDDRGHLREPHTGHGIGLGTLSVRHYQSKIGQFDFKEPSFAGGGVVTRGPSGCFGAVLFIEKEGFMPLFEAVNLAERFDIALMSTKGLSNTAARQLVDEICGGQEIPLLVLHDFDKAGFSILGTLQRDTRRYSFMNDIEVIDLGLRLEDIEGLQREDAFDKGTRNARAWNLRENGATDEEIEFLLDHRVELNAMTSDQLVTFVEGKLEQHGIKKIIPNNEELAQAYRLFIRSQEAEQIIERELEQLDGNDAVEVAAISKELKISRRCASRLHDAVMAKHRQVSDIFCSDAGVGLMKIDAEITLSAIQHCQAQGIAVLPVHDSLIVPAPDAERTAEIMKVAFEQRFPQSRPCEVRIKNPLPQNGKNSGERVSGQWAA